MNTKLQQRYVNPVNRLFALGQVPTVAPAALGITAADKPQLWAMLRDDAFYDDPNAPEYYAPQHARQILLRMVTTDDLPELLATLDYYNSVEAFESCDTLMEFAIIGRPLLSPLMADVHSYRRSDISSSYSVQLITRLAVVDPGCRAEIVAFFIAELERRNFEHRELNSFIICGLIDLQAPEAIDIIRVHYAADAVVTSLVGTLAHVEYDLGLRAEPPTLPRYPDLAPLYNTIEQLAAVGQRQLNPRERAERRKKKAQNSKRRKGR